LRATTQVAAPQRSAAFIRRRAVVIALACAALGIALRVTIAVAGTSGGQRPIDPDGYLVHAERLAASHARVATALTDADGRLRAPVYPALLAIGIDVGASPRGLLVAQALVAGVTIVAVVIIAWLLAGARAAAVAGVLAALWPASLSASASFWSEAIYVPLGAAALAILCASRRA
jgi:hypothetical protein